MKGLVDDGTGGLTAKIIGAAITVHRHWGPGLLVEEKVVVEVKAVDQLPATGVAQVLTYLALADLHVGLLFNFNVAVLVEGGLRRVFRR